MQLISALENQSWLVNMKTISNVEPRQQGNSRKRVQKTQVLDRLNFKENQNITHSSREKHHLTL